MNAPSRILTVVCALVSCVMLTQCSTLKQVASATGGDLSTPSHNLPQNEYPFDAKGNYREEWVVAPGGVNTSRRTPASSSSSRRSSSTSTRSTTSTKPVTVSTTSKPASSSGSSSKKTRYHLVQSGDTLYSLGRKYSTTVSAIKSANSLRSDTIRTGATLRIP